MAAEQEKNVGGSVYLIFIGLAVAVMGMVFVVLLYQSYVAAKETRIWPKVDAMIIESAVAERQFSKETAKEYSLKLLYEYQYEGESNFGANLKRRENPWYRNRDKITAAVEAYPVGISTVAFVNPELPDDPKKPREALLVHETKAGGYSIWFPGLFVIGGLGIVFRAIWQIFSSRRITQS